MVGSPTRGFQCHVGTIPILWSADNITAVKRSKIEEWWLDTCLCTQPYSSDYKRNMHLYCEAHASVLWGKNPSRYLEKRVGSWEDRKENILIVWNWPLFTHNIIWAEQEHSILSHIVVFHPFIGFSTYIPCLSVSLLSLSSSLSSVMSKLASCQAFSCRCTIK